MNADETIMALNRLLITVKTMQDSDGVLLALIDKLNNRITALEGMVNANFQPKSE